MAGELISAADSRDAVGGRLECEMANYLGMYRRARRGERGARIDHNRPRRGKRLPPYDRRQRRLVIVIVHDSRQKDSNA